MRDLDRVNSGAAVRQSLTSSSLLYWILVIGAVVSYVLNILVDNAVMFHDEYVYKAAADHRLPQAELYAKGAIEYIPNRLYVTVYRLASYCDQNYYAAAQFFNVVFWALGLLAVCKLAHMLGVSGRRLLVFAGLAVLLPFATYTKYIMPEAMYFCLFALYALLLFKAISSGAQRLMFAAGLVAGLDYYVKPHALFFVGATLLFLATTGGGRAGRWRSVCTHAAGFIAVVLIGRLLIHKPEGLASLGVYDQMVRGMAGTAATILKEPGAHLRAVGTVGLGHAVLLLSSWTIALAFALTACVAGLRGSRAGTADAARRNARLFGAWLMFVAAVLFMVVVAFTVLVGEVGRTHSRYYCFIYPYLLLALFIYDPAHFRRESKLAMSAVALVLGLALLAMPRYSAILGISLVSDSPELGFAFFPRPAAILLVVSLVAAQLWAVWRSPRPFWLMLAVSFACSQYYVREAQGHIFRGPYTDGRDAAALEQLLGPERMRAAVVVGDSRDVVSKFLFNLSVVPFIAQRPFDQVGHLVKDYPDADTFLLLTDRAQDIPGLTCEKMGQGVQRCQK